MQISAHRTETSEHFDTRGYVIIKAHAICPDASNEYSNTDAVSFCSRQHTFHHTTEGNS